MKIIEAKAKAREFLSLAFFYCKKADIVATGALRRWADEPDKEIEVLEFLAMKNIVTKILVSFKDKISAIVWAEDKRSVSFVWKGTPVVIHICRDKKRWHSLRFLRSCDPGFVKMLEDYLKRDIEKEGIECESEEDFCKICHIEYLEPKDRIASKLRVVF
jgi:DNA polymerase/3'-5' exonuclease PolX